MGQDLSNDINDTNDTNVSNVSSLARIRKQAAEAREDKLDQLLEENDGLYLNEEEEEDLKDEAHIYGLDLIHKATAHYTEVTLSYYYGKCKYWFKVKPIPFAGGEFKTAFEAVLVDQDVPMEYRQKYGAPVFISTCYCIKIKNDKLEKGDGVVLEREGWDQELSDLDLLHKLVSEWNATEICDKIYKASKGAVLRVYDGNGVFADDEYVLIERLMSSFEKFNLPKETIKGAEALSVQAFCHWTYHRCKGKILLSDAQGMRTDEMYVITDPFYLNSKEDTDMINQWFSNHKCNKFCSLDWKIPDYVYVQELDNDDPYGFKRFANVEPTSFC